MKENKSFWSHTVSVIVEATNTFFTILWALLMKYNDVSKVAVFGFINPALT